jgi:hypothetical protein
VNLSIEEVIIVKSLEWLKHFFNGFLKALISCFILHLLGTFVKSLEFVVDSLLFLLEEREEDLGV